MLSPSENGETLEASPTCGKPQQSQPEALPVTTEEKVATKATHGEGELKAAGLAPSPKDLRDVLSALPLEWLEKAQAELEARAAAGSTAPAQDINV